MTLVALVVAHNLVFLFAYGSRYDEALARSGHDGSWGTAVAVVLAAGIGLFALALWRLYRLRVTARRLDATASVYAPAVQGFGPRLLGLWWRLALVTIVLFVVQENLERLSIGEMLPGLGVLGSDQYRDATLIILGVTLAVAFVGALFRWRRDVLIARIAVALRRSHPLPDGPVRRPATHRDRRPESHVGRGLGVRAPPVPAL